MLESEAKKKICPIMSVQSHAISQWMRCQGSDCMGWDEHLRKATDLEYGLSNRRWIPHDPPQGECGMKPKELECNYG